MDVATRTCILVLGMHRSGTSAVCGLLSQLGAERPLRELPPSPTNLKGYFEPREIVAIHDRLLDSAGSHWADWDPFPSAWFESALSEDYLNELVQAVREDFPTRAPFLLKDPRICRFASLWLTVLERIECRPVVLFQYRDPMEVALSLKSRNGLSIEQGILLWLRHVLDAEKATRDVTRSFVFYAAIFLDWQSELTPTIESVWPKLPRQSARALSDVEDFIDDSLRHHRKRSTSQHDLHQWLARTLEALHVLRDQPCDPSAMVLLDDVRLEFDRACSLFTPVMHGLTRQIAKLERADASAEINALRARADQVPQLEADLAGTRQLLQALEPVRGRADVLEAEADASRQSLAALDAELNRARDAHAHLLAASARELSEAVEPLRTRAEGLEAEAEASRQTLAAVQAELVVARDAHAKLLITSARELSEAVEPLRIRTSNLEAEAEASRQALAETRAELDAAKNAHASLLPMADKLAPAEAALANATVELEHSRPLAQQASSLKAELDQVRQELTEHERELEIAKMELARTLRVRLREAFGRWQRS